MEEKEPLDLLKEQLKSYVDRQEKEKKEAPHCASPEEVRARNRRIRLVLETVFLMAAAVFIYAAFPGFIASVQPERTIRLGAYGADPQTEKCIKNLWLLASGSSVSPEPVCPVSGSKYKAEAGRFLCPNPEKHGLRELCFQPRRGLVAKGQE